ncbi:hypothetical protein FRC04_010254 [Tulasnella sp. 424]|nr:hypothetical protein FRC04_010254 [Tulasnella sp. 424]
MGEFNAGKQLFTPVEELTVVKFLIKMGRRGFPLTHRLIYKKLVRLLEAKCRSSIELGQQFVNRFLHRHPSLSTYRSTLLECNRASGMNPTAVKDYLNMVDELFTTHNPPKENVLGMDEVGMNTGIFARQLVIAKAGQCHIHLHKDGECKITMVIETIAGNGTTLRQTVIFKGKYRMSSWIEDNPDQANVTVSLRGYTENLIGLEYIKDFHEQTAHLQGARFLFMDGHHSHCTIEFLEFVVAHNIIVISYPPHTMHELQGLDVACFGALKIYWTQECDRYWRSTGKRARACAFTQETIRSAFRTMGLIPFHHDFLHPDAKAPALEASVKGGFPLPITKSGLCYCGCPSVSEGYYKGTTLEIVPEGEEDKPETRQTKEISFPEQATVESRPSEPLENGHEDATGEAEVNLVNILQSTPACFLVTDLPLKSTVTNRGIHVSVDAPAPNVPIASYPTQSSQEIHVLFFFFCVYE